MIILQHSLTHHSKPNYLLLRIADLICLKIALLLNCWICCQLTCADKGLVSEVVLLHPLRNTTKSAGLQFFVVQMLDARGASTEVQWMNTWQPALTLHSSVSGVERKSLKKEKK